MKRRDFIALLGGAAAAWSLAPSAQQPDAGDRISPQSGIARRQCGPSARSCVRASKTPALVEGENVAIEYRWAEEQVDRSPPSWRPTWFAGKSP